MRRNHTINVPHHRDGRCAGVVRDHVVAAWHGHDEYIMRKVNSHASFDGLTAAGSMFAAC